MLENAKTQKVRRAFSEGTTTFNAIWTFSLVILADARGCLLLVFVHVYVQAGVEEVQLGHEPLVHGHHLVLLLGQRGVVPQQAHAKKQTGAARGRPAYQYSARELAPVGRRVCAFSSSFLHGSFLSLLQSLPVLLQGADGVPCLAAGPPQWAVGQDALRVRFFGTETQWSGRGMISIWSKND